MRSPLHARGLLAALCILLAAGSSWMTPASAADRQMLERKALSSKELAVFLHGSGKPASSGAMSTAARRGNDACRWANDRECDEPGIGSGTCATGTDYSDCRFLRLGENDSCEWARDGECDEPDLGSGLCTQGADRTDCAAVAYLRFRSDSCATAFNGICEERGSRKRTGSPVCAPRTDRADCVGRDRPRSPSDHFHGRDDRVLVDGGVYPWSAIGMLELDDGSECTAALVAKNVVITAAHCVHDDQGRVAAAGLFRAGGGRPAGALEAHVVRHFVAPRFDHRVFLASARLDGADWAYLRLDRPLGDALGVLPLSGLARVDGAVLSQAGYAWDTEGRLAGHIGCEATRIGEDGTLEHTCDTTRGDSGSPLMLASGEGYALVGIVSNLREKGRGPLINVAARAEGFAPYLKDFAAGKIGTAIEP